MRMPGTTRTRTPAVSSGFSMRPRGFEPLTFGSVAGSRSQMIILHAGTSWRDTRKASAAVGDRQRPLKPTLDLIGGVHSGVQREPPFSTTHEGVCAAGPPRLQRQPNQTKTRCIASWATVRARSYAEGVARRCRARYPIPAQAASMAAKTMERRTRSWLVAKQASVLLDRGGVAFAGPRDAALPLLVERGALAIRCGTSLRLPASACAWRTHCRHDSGPTSRSVATCVTDRPVPNAVLTARAFNSAEYCRPRVICLRLPFLGPQSCLRSLRQARDGSTARAGGQPWRPQ